MAKKLTLQVGERLREVEFTEVEGDSLSLQLDGVEHAVELQQVGEGPLYELVLDHHATEVLIKREGPALRLIIGADSWVVTRRRPGAGELAADALEAGELVVRAPMTGVVMEVLVRPGDQVAQRDSLLVIQAMKMNNEIRAPAEGTVTEVSVSVEQTVNQGDPLLTIHLGAEETNGAA